LAYARWLDPSGPYQDAEDRVQETFKRLTEKWPIEKPIPYAYRTVRNLTVDDGRRRKTRPESPDSPSIEASDSSLAIGPTEITLSNEGELAILRAVHTLPTIVQDLFFLHYVEDMTIAEVAEHLGLTDRRTYYYRDKIRKKVRAMLSEAGETEDPDPNAP
jgi:RNA polymerase sigma factor (sigma-70 family)